MPQNTARQAEQCPRGPEMRGLEFEKKKKEREKQRLRDFYYFCNNLQK